MSIRLEVRLDEKCRARLEEIAEYRSASISEVVRALIDEAYQANSRERRKRALQRITTLNVEEMPDPEELARELNKKYEPADYNL